MDVKEVKERIEELYGAEKWEKMIAREVERRNRWLTFWGTLPKIASVVASVVSIITLIIVLKM